MYGEDKLIDLLEQVGDRSPDEIKGEIIDSLDEYDFDDDITMVILKRNE